MTFLIFPRYSSYSMWLRWANLQHSNVKFLQDSVCQKWLKSVHFDGVIQKIKIVIIFLGHSVRIEDNAACAFAHRVNAHDRWPHVFDAPWRYNRSQQPPCLCLPPIGLLRHYWCSSKVKCTVEEHKLTAPVYLQDMCVPVSWWLTSPGDQNCYFRAPQLCF